MLQIDGDLEAAVRRRAARADTAPEVYLAQLLELSLALMEAALAAGALEADDDDPWRPPPVPRDSGATETGASASAAGFRRMGRFLHLVPGRLRA